MAISYNTKIVTDNLVLCLDAANSKSYSGSGTVWTDISRQGNTGTLINGPTFSTSNRGSIAFDGVDDFVEIQNSTLLNSETNTLICWAKSNIATWNNTGFLMSKRDVFVMHPGSGTKQVDYYYYLNGSWQVQSIVLNDITTWNMFACSWDGIKITSYLNGQEINSGVKTGPLNTSDTGVMTIGRDDGLSRYLNGNISFCAMYNRALSASEIQQNFNALRGRYGI